MTYGFDDDDGQDDGESVGHASPFATRMVAMPWSRNTAEPPWHLWGNTQTLELNLPAGQQFSAQSRGQLTKVAYGRPDTWHWLFTAQLVEGDDADPGEPLTINITWEVMTGVGRSVQINRAFDVWNVGWGAPDPDAFPRRTLWANETFQQSLGRLITPDPVNRLSELVAQDIQVTVRASLIRSVSPGTAKRAVIDVGAQWAPKTHIRPDWLRFEVPEEAQFPGGEIAAR